MSTPDKRERLLEILKEKSFRTGRFTLASGKISDFYLDCRVTALDAEGATLIGELFFERIEQLGKEYKAVGGITLGADPLVTATSVIGYRRGKVFPAFIIRKEVKGHGTKQYVEGLANLKEGDPVILLEDVITTGGSLKKAYDRAVAAGLKPVHGLALVDRMEGGREFIEGFGLPMGSLFTRHDFFPEEAEELGGNCED